MTTRDDAASGGYRSLGLLANPFVPLDESDEPLPARLAYHAAAMRLLVALDSAAADPERKPIVVVKTEGATFYHISALAEILDLLVHEQPLGGVLPAYVPVDMMRMGRVRASLSAVAERVATNNPDLLIAAWLKRALGEPDTALAEWTELSACAEPEQLIAAIDADPAAFVARCFGEPVESRPGAEDSEQLMRVAFARQDRLEIDPAEGEAGLAEPEEVDDDPLAEAFVRPLGEVDENALESAPEDEPEAFVEPLVAYTVAYLRAAISPVVARGVLAYRAQGTASMAQELKITKAPSKTLAALIRFASAYYRSVVILFDRFEIWESVPADLRHKIVGTLQELRWTVREGGNVVLFLETGNSPEVEEAFAAAGRVAWGFEELPAVLPHEAAFDTGVAEAWAASASLDSSPPAWAAQVIAAVPPQTGLAEGCEALGLVISRSAESGSTPEPSSVVSALEEVRASQTRA